MTTSSASTTSRPRLAVLTVTYNSEPLLPDFLAAVSRAAGEATGESWQLVVVDNASSDGSVDAITEQCPSAAVIPAEENRGYAAGLNLAFRAIEADAYLVLNPDVRPDPDSIARLLEKSRDPSVGIVVPRISNEDGTLAFSLRREPTVLRALGEALLGGRRAGKYDLLGGMVCDATRYGYEHDVDWASGAALLVTSKCTDSVGLWDESFFLYSEETDFASRARDLGYRIQFDPDARMVHIGGEVHSDPRLWTILTWNRLTYYRRRHGRFAYLAFAAAVWLNEALRALAGRKTSRAALRSLVRLSRRPPEIHR